MLLFAASLFCLVLLVNAGVFCVWALMVSSPLAVTELLQLYAQSGVAGWVSLATLLVFSSGTVHRFIQLNKSTTALAELMGAKEITGTALTAKEKELTNVVAEMAVASGVPVPRLFVMRQELAINAFVTGNPAEYSLVVTQGALEQLDRDELQGVIGHEFSHLLHGDVQLNLNMLAMLAGLVAVSRVGKMLVRVEVSSRSTGGRMRGRSNQAGTLIAFGVLLIVAGYAGLVLGRLIKAAVSRQREMLADASSVQFTRNPSGLAGALIKIRNGTPSILTNQYAEDVSHMCFANAVNMWWQALFATHPPIDVRLRHLGPGWEARARVRQQRVNRNDAEPVFNANAMGYAHSLIASLPVTMTQLLSDEEGARLMVYALIMAGSQRLIPAPTELTKAQREYLPTLMAQIRTLGKRTRIPLLDLAVPTIQSMEVEQHRLFLRNVDELIRADGRVTVFEYLLRQLIYLRLYPLKVPEKQYVDLAQVAQPLMVLFSALIYQSSKVPAEQQALFATYVAPLVPENSALLPASSCGLVSLREALEEVRALTSFLKQLVLDVCADIVMADNKIQVEELELLRLVCLLTDSPIPPLFVATSGPVAQ